VADAMIEAVILTDCPLFEPSCPGRIGWLTPRSLNVWSSLYHAEIHMDPFFADHNRKETTVEGHIETRLYQAQLLHKEFVHPLNVVIIVKTNLRTQAQGHVLLFTSDLTLAYASLIDYYGLRFQIEFNFRDAKQYWGLEDFMNITPTGVTNAANLSLFMVNVAYRLRAEGPPCDPAYSVLDLKADCRGYKYVEETIKMLPDKPEPLLLAKILHQVACLGRIHASQPSFSLS
jgi:hypothetical protein